MRNQLQEGAPELRQTYARPILKDVTVKPEQIRIGGSKAALTRTAAKDEARNIGPVLSFVWEWRTQDDEDENWVIIV